MKEYTGERSDSGFAETFGLRYMSTSDFVTYDGPLMSVSREGGGWITCEYRNEYGTYLEWAEFQWTERGSKRRTHRFSYEGTMEEMSCGEKYTTLLTTDRLYLFYWDGARSPKLLYEWDPAEFSRRAGIPGDGRVICADTATLPGSVILDYTASKGYPRWKMISSGYGSEWKDERRDLPDIDCENKIVSLWDLPLPEHFLRAEGGWAQSGSILVLSDECAQGIPIVFGKDMEGFIASRKDAPAGLSVCRRGFALLTDRELEIYECLASFTDSKVIKKAAGITLSDLRSLTDLDDGSGIEGAGISLCGNFLTLDIQKGDAGRRLTVPLNTLFADLGDSRLSDPVSEYSYIEFSDEQGSRTASLVISEVRGQADHTIARFPLEIGSSEEVIGHSACKRMCAVLTDRYLYLIEPDPNVTARQPQRLDMSELKQRLNVPTRHRVTAADSATLRGHILFDVEAEGKTETIAYPLRGPGAGIRYEKR